MTDGNLVNLHKYLDEKFSAIRESVEIRFVAAREQAQANAKFHDEALKLAAAVANEKYSTLNQLRREVVTDREQYARIGDIANLRERMEREVTLLRETRATIVHNIEEQISDLQISRATLAGKASQNSVVVAWAMSGLGLLLGFISLLHVLWGK